MTHAKCLAMQQVDSNIVTTVIDYKSSLLSFYTFHKVSTASKSTSESGGPSVAMMVVSLEMMLEAVGYEVDP